MTRNWTAAALAGLLALGLLMRGPLFFSRALGNVGFVVLTRTLAASPKAPAPQPLARAERWLRQATSWDEGNRAAHRGLAWAMAMQGKDTEAAIEWQAAGLTAEDLIARGDQARRAKQYEEALWWYGQATLLEPGLQSGVHYLQSVALRESGDANSALAKLQEAISLDQGWLEPAMRFRAWNRWGAWLYQQDRDSEAANALAKAIALYPEGQQPESALSESYRLLGLVQRDQGKLEQAVQSLETAVRLNEQSVWAYIGLGKTLYAYDVQRLDQVESEFAVALSLKPDNVGIWEDLIRFWRRVGEIERAESLCLQAQTAGIASELEDVCPSP